MALSDGVFGRRLESFRSVFRIRAFALFSLGNFVTLVGLWMQRITIGWITWELTRSEFWLGVLAFAELFPAVIASLIGGYLADRYDRFRLLRFGQWLMALGALLMAGLQAAGTLSLAAMLPIMTAIGFIAGINLPSRLAITPALVPGPQLATASAVSAISFNITRMVGPLVAAPLLYFELMTLSFVLIALTYGFGGLCLSYVTADDARGARPARDPDGAGYLAVLRAMLTDRRIGAVLMLQLVTGALVRTVPELFPAFADEVFGRGEAGLAALNAALGIGAVGGALVVSGAQAGIGMRGHILFGSLVFAITIAAFASTAHLGLAMAILVLHGAAMTSSGVAATTYVQSNTPNARLGRIMSLYGLIFRGAPAIGAILLGPLAVAIGLQGATLLSVAAALIVLALLWRAIGSGPSPQPGEAGRD